MGPVGGRGDRQARPPACLPYLPYHLGELTGRPACEREPLLAGPSVPGLWLLHTEVLSARLSLELPESHPGCEAGARARSRASLDPPGTTK